MTAILKENKNWIIELGFGKFSQWPEGDQLRLRLPCTPPSWIQFFIWPQMSTFICCLISCVGVQADLSVLVTCAFLRVLSCTGLFVPKGNRYTWKIFCHLYQGRQLLWHPVCLFVHGGIAREGKNLNPRKQILSFLCSSQQTMMTKSFLTVASLACVSTTLNMIHFAFCLAGRVK